MRVLTAAVLRTWQGWRPSSSACTCDSSCPYSCASCSPRVAAVRSASAPAAAPPDSAAAAGTASPATGAGGGGGGGAGVAAAAAAADVSCTGRGTKLLPSSWRPALPLRCCCCCGCCIWSTGCFLGRPGFLLIGAEAEGSTCCLWIPLGRRVGGYLAGVKRAGPLLLRFGRASLLAASSASEESITLITLSDCAAWSAAVVTAAAVGAGVWCPSSPPREAATGLMLGVFGAGPVRRELVHLRQKFKRGRH
jgi:hypothetical protein